MSQFHLRLPPDLKVLLEQAGETNGNSLNREILERLSRSFSPDPAIRLADAVRPHLEALGGDSDEAARMIVGLLEVASRKRPARKRR